MRPHPRRGHIWLPPVAGLLLAACASASATPAQPDTIQVPAAVAAAVLPAARARVPAITACGVGWIRPMSASESAVVFTCTGRGGPYEGALYYASPQGVVFTEVTAVDRRAAFTHAETSGERVDGAGQYEIVSGVVNRTAIDTMTIGYADGTLGMMQIGDARPRVYAFVHTGAYAAVKNITAYIGDRAAFIYPPNAPAPR